MTKPEGCRAIRYFDQYVCKACNKCWDVDDEPAECNPPAPPVPHQFKETLRLRQSKMIGELKRNISDKKD